MTEQTANATNRATPPGDARSLRIAVIGGGVIGKSWTALFLAGGHYVSVYDVAPDTEERVREGIAAFTPALAALGYRTASLTDCLRFSADLAAAVRDADVVQENGPDRLGLKRALWGEVERHARPDALFLSSSSGIKATWQSAGMRNPNRMLIGHPFNPPHLIPLVEVVPGRRTSARAVDEAVAFYRSLGKHPIVIRREVTGFVANRLQAALFRESVSLVKSGVVTVEELDDIVTHSIGLRWATGGPFVSCQMGGGPSGFSGFLRHFAAGMQFLWLQFQLKPIFLSRSVRRTILAQIGASFGRTPIPELEARRESRQIAVLKALKTP